MTLFPCQDSLEVRTSTTTTGDEKNHSDPLALIFIYNLTYLEEELAWKHTERLLRATSTCDIFTVLIYKKVFLKTPRYKAGVKFFFTFFTFLQSLGPIYSIFEISLEGHSRFEHF